MSKPGILEHRGAVVDLKVGERLTLDNQLGRSVTVTLEHKSGQLARLRIAAEESIKIELPHKLPAPAG